MKVILYSNKCPQCRYLESLLKSNDIEYDEVNDIKLMKEKGFMSMPMLEVDGEIMTYQKSLQWVKQ